VTNNTPKAELLQYVVSQKKGEQEQANPTAKTEGRKMIQ